MTAPATAATPRAPGGTRDVFVLGAHDVHHHHLAAVEAVHTVTRTRLTCDRDRFHLYATLGPFEVGDRVHTGTWHRSIPRRLV